MATNPTASYEDTPTPGPWKIGETSITACAGYCTVLRIENGSLVIDKPQDARLIEAAPELYEALRKMRGCFSGFMAEVLGSDGGEIREWLEFADKALALVRGDA